MAQPSASEAFHRIVTRHSSQGNASSGLVNVTFFVGAGFSKTWDTTSPTGNELFTFPKEFLAGMADDIEIDELLAQGGVTRRGRGADCFRRVAAAARHGPQSVA